MAIPIDYKMARPTRAEIDSWFEYHAPNEVQIAQYAVLREKGKELAEAMMLNCPESADRTAAIRKVREAVMTANASIACAPAITVNGPDYVHPAQLGRGVR